ncbi:methyltransferase domain-containing protein [Halomonas sp. BC04]|uniref:methyltransferase domain-containing protein n=1 Tax=Halomonas sp. BC04 TaxID=1403540 RepID=UPI0004B2E15D
MTATGFIAPSEAKAWHSRVAHAFSRAAPHYASLAGAQLSMGEALWRHLPSCATAILDLGCGPGHWSSRLASRYGARARVTGLDLAPGMLAEARDVHGERVQWLQADAGALPLEQATQDVIFSNLAIQWCPDLDGVLSEIQRVLRPGGRALINTLGPGTLAEVGHAWSSSGLLGFRTREQHLASARLAGFDGIRLEERVERFFYPDLAAVMASIKASAPRRHALMPVSPGRT